MKLKQPNSSPFLPPFWSLQLDIPTGEGARHHTSRAGLEGRPYTN
jgi:hypothetical protein